MLSEQRALFTDKNGFGRIPFALIAVSILLTSAIISESMLNIARLKGDPELKSRFIQVEAVAAEESQAIESITVYTLSSILSNLSSLTELAVRSLNKILLDDCKERFDNRYPVITEGYVVELNDHHVSVMIEWAQVTGGTGSQDPIDPGQYPVYLRVIGFADIEIRSKDGSNLSARKLVEFDRKVMVPLPLLINSIEVFRAATQGSRSDLARLVQYILTTTVQMRVLAGEGISAGSKSDLLSRSDVRSALNLAMILEQARIFRTYDADAVDALGLNEMLEDYLSSGELDGADLYFLLNNMDDQGIDPGRILSEAIMVYADEFVYRLLCNFWPEQTPDAPLQEPNYSYSAIKAKGEAFAKQKLRAFLDKFRHWLILPPLIFPHFGSANIPKISRHATSVDETSKYPVPMPVRGDYDLFSMPYPTKWFAVSGGVHTDPGSWPPALSTIDAVDLILGESSDADLRPEPYEITFFSTFGLPRTIKYYMVNQSFAAMYADPNSTTPYFDCLRYIMETVSAGISLRKIEEGVPKDGTGKGMLDLMAEDAGTLAGTNFPETKWSELTGASKDPLDGVPVMTGGTRELVDKRFVPALSSFRKLARGQELSSVIPGAGSWYESGLLRPDDENNGLYRLVRSTVDLFYELYLTMYESSNAKAGKLDGNWAWNLPEIYYAPIDDEQVKSRVNDNFNFNRDAVKHAYNSVWTIVLLHLAGSKSYFHPDAVSPGEFRYATPPIPEAAWLLYGWDKYPWDLSCSNLHLWDDVKKALKPALKNAFTGEQGVSYESGLAMKILNLSTDSREYGTMFYEFLWLNIGRNVIGPPGISQDSTIESLIAPEGWLEEMLAGTMPGEMNDHIEYRDLIVRTNVLADLPFLFEQDYVIAQEKTSYSFEENFNLLQTPPHSQSKKDLSIEIVGPVCEPRFVSVQESGCELSDAPFVTSWTINVNGTMGLEIRSERKDLLTEKGYVPLDLHEQFKFDFCVPIVVFTGWPLNGMIYPMTRSVMGDLNNGSGPDSDISKRMQELLDAQILLETEVLDKARVLTDFVSSHPLGVLFEYPGLHLNETELFHNLNMAKKPISNYHFSELKDKQDKFFQMFRSRTASIRTRFWGMERSFQQGSSFYINISIPGGFGYLLKIKFELGNNKDVCRLSIGSGYAEIELTAINSVNTPGASVEAVISTPRYTIGFLSEVKTTLLELYPFFDKPGTEEEQLYEHDNALFYFLNTSSDDIYFISLSVANAPDVEGSNNYLEVIRSVRSDLLDHFKGSNGGSWAALPASLFFRLKKKELEPGGLLLTAGIIDPSQNRFRIHTVTLDELFGPAEMYNGSGKRNGQRLDLCFDLRSGYVLTIQHDHHNV